MSSPARTTGLGRWALLAICACVLVAQSVVAAVNLMIPQLAASALHPSPSQLLWTVDAYVIAFAGLLIPAGALGDRLGRRRALLAGLALFALGSAVAALAGTPGILITGRALSGAGAALIMPATMSILVHLAGPEGRIRALASWTLSLGLGGLLGNLGGGLVAQYLPWQALFGLMPPLAALLALAVLRTVPVVPTHPSAPDPIGSALLIGGVTAILYGIIEGPGHGWASPQVLGAFAAGALLLAAFTAYGLRAARPLVDPRLLRSRRLRAGLLGSAASFFGLFGLFYVNSQFLQYVKGYSAALTGFAIGPLAIGMVLVPRVAVRLQVRYGPRPLAGGGLALIAAGLLCVSTAGPATPYPLYAGWLLLLSIGFGLSAPALANAVVSELPPQQAGLGAGLNTAARELGAALGVATVGTVLAVRFAGRPSEVIPAAARLGAERHAAVLAEFGDATSLGLRVLGLLVLLAAAAVTAGLRPEPTAVVARAAHVRSSG
ncbi:MFS transporter [Kitasatospora paracochleata]|uniref:MFS family permease n=1 Tax=Kitasatospora paracochleata TaxID=58354 RepID=A0ABT1J5A2_9ACTN|nr:MFS transporter [Kitasatospora paracochleata]MCP2312573.1 MFS family permease [Kitasatospora paracochleata]